MVLVGRFPLKPRKAWEQLTPELCGYIALSCSFALALNFLGTFVSHLHLVFPFPPQKGVKINQLQYCFCRPSWRSKSNQQLHTSFDVSVGKAVDFTQALHDLGASAQQIVGKLPGRKSVNRRPRQNGLVVSNRKKLKTPEVKHHLLSIHLCSFSWRTSSSCGCYWKCSCTLAA